MDGGEIHIISVAKCRYIQGTHIPKHDHPFYHLIYTTGGIARMNIGTCNYMAQQDDLYMIPPGVDHEFISDRTHPLHTLEVKCYLRGKHLDDRIQQLPVRIRCRDDDVRGQLEVLLREARQRLPFHKEMMRNGLHQCLLHLFRGQAETVPGQSTANSGRADPTGTIQSVDATTSNDEIIDQVMDFIMENFHQKITLHGLSREFAMCEEHLCRLFRKKAGISPIQYVNRLRIEKAKELLVHSELSVGEISEKTGFQSLHHLSRYFSGKVRLSPIEYRQLHGGSTYFYLEDEVN